ncbi:MAG TPA: hypothetical protein VHX16_01615 [Chloroflexota bacterium]|jgi:hypothetical protein|nr:hypothetical protein [Chloroflexota bacterium]
MILRSVVGDRAGLRMGLATATISSGSVEEDPLEHLHVLVVAQDLVVGAPLRIDLGDAGIAGRRWQ